VRELRTMDCVDCHNRPTHIYGGTPEHAIDKAFTDGALDRSVPWLHKVALEVLKSTTPPREAAEAGFRAALAAAYGRLHADARPDDGKLDAAARTLATLYLGNVFPGMHVTWGTYPSNIGHGGPDPGNSKEQCFRCHSGEHKNAAGEKLTDDCEGCHTVVAKDVVPDDLPDELRAILPIK
jgi:hypothetical protein